VVEQGGQVAVSGLGGDPVDRSSVGGGRGRVPGAQRMAADAEGAESGRGGAVTDEVTDGALPDTVPTDRAGRGHPREERTPTDRADVEPRAEGPDRIGQ
jgi:hypothetical protein